MGDRGVGRAAIQAIAAHPELELVGVWVHSPDKEGVDAGELAGDERRGVAATNDVDALLAQPADCVAYAPLLPDEALVARILASGKNVMTPLNWSIRVATTTRPWRRRAPRARSPCMARASTPVGSPNASR